jgi:Flp pilus assembly protein TadG
MAMHGKPARRGWDEGAVAVEAALTIGVLIFLIFGVIEFGMAMGSWNTMVLAVEDAGRYVMVHNTSCNTSCAVAQMQATLAAVPGTVSTTCTKPAANQFCLSASTTAGTPSTMTLTAALGYNVIGLPRTFTLTSQGTFPID